VSLKRGEFVGVRLLAFAAALSSLIASPIHAEDAPGLTPSSAWTLDYDDDSCALRRVFGEGEDQAYLEIRRFEPGPGLQTIIGSKRMSARHPVQFRYRFSGNAEWQEVRGGNTVALNSGFRSGVLFDPILIGSPAPEQLEDPLQRAADVKPVDLRAWELQVAARITGITLRGAFPKELTLQLGRLDAPIAALNECIDDLITHWNIDVEAHKTLTRRATPINLTQVGRLIDYPPEMLTQNLQGLVNIRLGVDDTGRIIGCHIQMPLSDPVFEETSCTKLQRALDFEPAFDKDGKPIASYWTTKVRFQL
jgi:hypothetical protein